MRSSKVLILAVVTLGMWTVAAPPSVAQIFPALDTNAQETAIVDSSTEVLHEIMSIPGKGIPATLLAKAQGVVIVPHMLKGGFVIGVKHGRGVLLVRDANNTWQAPQFITINGGSVGWQAGIQATDLVLVFTTQKGVQGLLSGEFTIGADAAAAAGPVGRETSASTNGKLQAEIYSYSRSRGLFVGVSLDGSKLKVDRNATELFYRPQVAVPAGQPTPLPASAGRLIEELSKYSVKGVTETAVVVPTAAPKEVAMVPVQTPAQALTQQTAREQLSAASVRLSGLLDAQWRNYLALPAETFGGNHFPTTDALEQALTRFKTVAANPQYAALTSRPEFVETSKLLQQLIDLTPRPTLSLPPPPQ